MRKATRRLGTPRSEAVLTSSLMRPGYIGIAARIRSGGDAGRLGIVGARGARSTPSERPRPCRRRGDPGAGVWFFSPAAASPATRRPGQHDPLRLGGGLRADDAVRNLLSAQYFARSEGRHRRLERGRFRQRADRRRFAATATHLYPAFPYTSYRLHDAQGRPRPLSPSCKTLPPVTGRAPQDLARLSVRHPPRASDYGSSSILRSAARSTRPAQRGLAAGPLSRRGPGPLRGMPFAARHPRRSRAGQRLTGGPLPDGKGKAPALTPKG